MHRHVDHQRLRRGVVGVDLAARRESEGRVHDALDLDAGGSGEEGHDRGRERLAWPPGEVHEQNLAHLAGGSEELLSLGGGRRQRLVAHDPLPRRERVPDHFGLGVGASAEVDHLDVRHQHLGVVLGGDDVDGLEGEPVDLRPGSLDALLVILDDEGHEAPFVGSQRSDQLRPELREAHHRHVLGGVVWVLREDHGRHRAERLERREHVPGPGGVGDGDRVVKRHLDKERADRRGESHAGTIPRGLLGCLAFPLRRASARDFDVRGVLRNVLARFARCLLGLVHVRRLLA
mmetsp:Transcript_53213/g.126594  ORF Transcript_53213/g.126594 Transcript_53213/m.126594 type:complete len:290 (-) Transcript_53213:86-955(-)